MKPIKWVPCIIGGMHACCAGNNLLGSKGEKKKKSVASAQVEST